MGIGKKRLKWERENDVFKVVSIIPRSVLLYRVRKSETRHLVRFMRSLKFFFKNFLCFIIYGQKTLLAQVKWGRRLRRLGRRRRRRRKRVVSGFIIQRSRIPIGSASALGSRVSATWQKYQQTKDAFAWVSKIEVSVPHKSSQAWHGLSSWCFVLFSCFLKRFQYSNRRDYT